MIVAFTIMSGLYLSALALGAAANAIFLQNTAPVWVYLFAILILGEAADRRGLQSVCLAVVGAIIIVAGGWPRNLPTEEVRNEVLVLFMGLGSGIVYAVVVILLRILREHSTAWLVSLNLLGTAFTLGLFVIATEGPSAFAAWVTAPSPEQVGVLVMFGVLQMALPYWLFTRGLRGVSPMEAAIITLIEPLLNPIWAFLLTPEKDTPTIPMLVGGFLILMALLWRYVPVKSRRTVQPSSAAAATDRVKSGD
jgi:drug/metabolite transporter (DMT)-like permease